MKSNGIDSLLYAVGLCEKYPSANRYLGRLYKRRGSRCRDWLNIRIKIINEQPIAKHQGVHSISLLLVDVGAFALSIAAEITDVGLLGQTGPELDGCLLKLTAGSQITKCFTSNPDPVRPT